MGDSAPDKRLAWLGARVCTTLKLKDDVWKAILAGENKCDRLRLMNFFCVFMLEL